MADHFFAANPGEGSMYRTDTITVGVASSAAQKLELRVTDGSCTAEQVYFFLEKLAGYFAARNKGVVPTDMLTG